MEKKQYDETITTLLLAHRDDLAQALSSTAGFELCQQLEQLEARAKKAEVHVGLAARAADQCRDLYNKTLPNGFEGTTVVGMFTAICGVLSLERNQAEVVRNDLAATYKTITELRGQVAELEAELKTASKSAASLIIQLQEARAELFDLYHQECYSGPVDGIAKYDNQCMSCYEYAEDKLIEWGLLKPEQCLRRFPAHDEKEKK